MVDEAHAFYKCLASLRCDKWSEVYASLRGGVVAAFPFLCYIWRSGGV